MIYQLYTLILGHSDRLNEFRNNQTSHDVSVHPSASIGRRTEFYGNVNIKRDASISWFCTLSGNVSIGKGTGMNGRNNILGHVSVGNYCAIAPRARINATAHNTSYASLQETFNSQIGVDISDDHQNDPVEIGNDVWICADSKVISGVTIGDGAIVAANSVVVDDVEPYSFVAGNPARHKKYRFDEETRKKLQEIEWWNWNEKRIRRNKEFFNTDLTEVDDINDLIN